MFACFCCCVGCVAFVVLRCCASVVFVCIVNVVVFLLVVWSL